MASHDYVGTCSLGLGTLLLATGLHAQAIPFTPEHWDLTNARVVEHLRRQALAGTAVLRDAAFTNGVIEVDIAMQGGARAYPGVLFRMQSDEKYERMYLRLHRAPLYSDAIQYRERTAALPDSRPSASQRERHGTTHPGSRRRGVRRGERLRVRLPPPTPTTTQMLGETV